MCHVTCTAFRDRRVPILPAISIRLPRTTPLCANTLVAVRHRTARYTLARALHYDPRGHVARSEQNMRMFSLSICHRKVAECGRVRFIKSVCIVPGEVVGRVVPQPRRTPHQVPGGRCTRRGDRELRVGSSQRLSAHRAECGERGRCVSALNGCVDCNVPIWARGAVIGLVGEFVSDPVQHRGRP